MNHESHNLLTARMGSGLSELPSGKILVMGGWAIHNLTDIFVLDPDTGKIETNEKNK